MNPIKKGLILAGGGQWYFEKWWLYRRDGEIISDWHISNGILFFHIPKSAGTSIRKALGMPDLSYTHFSASVVKKLYPVEFDKLHKFSVVRNPFDRFASTYKYVTSRSDWSEQRDWSDSVIGGMSFSAFVDRMKSSRLYRNRVLGYEFFFPQTYFTHIDGKLAMNNILRFDSLDEDFKKLHYLADVREKNLPSERQHQSVGSYRELYSDSDAAFVRDIYRSDFSEFGFSTEVSS